MTYKSELQLIYDLAKREVETQDRQLDAEGQRLDEIISHFQDDTLKEWLKRKRQTAKDIEDMRGVLDKFRLENKLRK